MVLGLMDRYRNEERGLIQNRPERNPPIFAFFPVVVVWEVNVYGWYSIDSLCITYSLLK